MEVVDRLPGGGAVRQRDRAEEFRPRLHLQVLDALVDVADVEGDVVAAPVGVSPPCLVLIRRRVLEELDVRPVPAAEHADLLHDRAGVHVDELCHEVARRIAERPERERVDEAELLLEPRGRHIDIRNGQADVVDAEQPGHVRDDGVSSVQLRRPERLHARHLIRHPIGVADELDVAAPRRLEVLDRLSGSGSGS